MIKKILSFPFILLIKFYQGAISPYLPRACRHVPSCSQYGISAFKTHGVLIGLTLTIWRVMRCHPWGTHGFDPVPPPFEKWKWLPVMLILLLLGCKQDTPTTTNAVTVSVAPQKYFIRHMLPDSIQINVLVPENESPATFDPLVHQVKLFNQSAVYVTNGGMTFETAWQQKLQAAAPKVKFFNMGEYANAIHGHHHGHKHQSGHEIIDPHYWVSPKQILQVLPHVYNYFIELKLTDSLTSYHNYHGLINEVRHFDSLFSQLANCPKKSFIIYHPALSYLARDYGIQQYSLEHDAKEPGIAGLKNLKNIAEAEQLKYVFVQQQFDIKNAQVLAREIGGEVLIIDPLSGNWHQAMTDIYYKLNKALND